MKYCRFTGRDHKRFGCHQHWQYPTLYIC